MKTDMKDRVALKTRLIIHEGSCSQRDLANYVADGAYGPIADPGIGCKLECGGQIVATGNLTKKRGKILFKILQTKKEAGDGSR